MIRRLRFALRYALRNMRRDRQRTAFALFSIAAGVATVVALRALGLMLTDALTSNIQASMRGDVYVSAIGARLQVSAFGGGSETAPIGSGNIRRIQDWAARNGYEVNFTLTSELMQTAIVRTENNQQRAGRPAFVLGHFIDPDRYPFYDTIRAEDPPGALLKSLFTGPNQMVVGKRLAEQLGVKVGDQMRIGTAQQLHTVTGIVADAAESNLTKPNLNSFLFSFVYLDRAALADFGLDPNSANDVYLKLPPGTEQAQVVQRIRAEWPTRRDNGSSIRWLIDYVDRALERNTFIADTMSRFVLLLSLVSLVIGGVGIINTMLVAVNRRSSEIAVLKTLGLKGRGVSLIFMAEAVVCSILGSLIGIAMGIVLSLIARNLGEQAFGVALPWRIYADPMVIGMLLGVTITVFFSLLPTLMAGQVRPNLVLRQGNIPLARAGLVPSLLTLVVLIVGIGTLVDLIIGGGFFSGRDGPANRVVNSTRFTVQAPLGLSPGIFGTLTVFVLLGIVIGLMWLLVWLLGKLPSFRNANLRIAVRGLTMHRMRTALSLLALTVGMTALSGTLIMTRSINTLLYTSVSEPLGGNIIVLPLLPVQSLVHNQFERASGVNGYRDVRFTVSQLIAIDGNRNFREQLVVDDDVQSELLVARLDLIVGVTIYGNPPRGTLVDGRYLGPEDAGKPNIVVPYEPQLAKLGVKVGSKFTYRVSTGRSRGSITTMTMREFTVVGLVAPDARAGLVPFSVSDSAVQAPLDSVARAAPFDLIVADVKPESVNDVMAAVGTVPGIFVFDISIFDSILNRLLSQMAALPLLIAGLSLFAATALIASTVSLATMERRRQIGILKAVGVKRRQALAQLLIENGIIGAVGGVISLLPTLLILLAVPMLTEGIVRLPVPIDLIVLMLALSVIITLAATLLTAWSAASEAPLRVLRYE